MKKVLCIILVLVLVFISCKAKQKPSGDNIGVAIGKGPSEVDLGGDFNSLNTTITEIANNFVAEKASWEAMTILTNFKDLELGYIVVRDKEINTWTILGITENQNVQLGTGGRAEGEKALADAAGSNNFDPRKLVFNDDGDPTKGLKIAWAGRAGVSSSEPNTAVQPYEGYDELYSHILYGEKTFKVLGDYKVVGFQEDVKAAEVAGLPISNSPKSLISYAYEKSGTATGGKRKAWFWWGSGDTSFTIGVPTTATVVKGSGIRFGYGINDTDYPSVGTLGVTEKGSELREYGKAAVYDNSAPDGKTFFTRYHGGKSVNFFTTMVAYNIRMRTPKNTNLLALEGVKIKEIKEGIMEFDGGSFSDAISDGFTHVTDIPTSAINGGNPDAELGGGGTKKNTIKVPFIFFRPM